MIQKLEPASFIATQSLWQRALDLVESSADPIFDGLPAGPPWANRDVSLGAFAEESLAICTICTLVEVCLAMPWDLTHGCSADGL